MLGLVAFLMVMTTTVVLSWLWINGKLPAFIADQRKKMEADAGRVYNLKILKWEFSIRVNRAFWVRLAFIVLGPAAILGLSIAYAEILPLRVVFALYVLPSYLAMLVLGIIYPDWGRRAAVGFTAGVIATLLYDVVRMIVVISLGLPDPIPHIGALWLGNAAFDGDLWWVGYLWRFFGNGAGMGIVYAMLPRIMFDLKGGWIYGEVIGLGMFATMLLFPAVQIHLFPVNAIVVINGILGHWAYGLALGWIFYKTKLTDKFKSHNAVKRKPETWKSIS